MKYEFKEEDIVNLATYRGRPIRMVAPDRQDYITKCIRDSRRFYEEGMFSGLLNMIPLNPNVIDIGAYTGSSALWFSTVAGARHVTAIEPDEYYISILDENIRLNDLDNSISTIQAAIGDSDGYAYHAFIPASNLGGSIYRKCDRDTAENVQMRSIDSLFKEDSDKVDVIHISMEGNEYKALQGATRLITRDKPLLVLEVWPCTTISIDPDYDCLHGYIKLTGELFKLGYVADGNSGSKLIFKYDNGL